MEVFVTSRAEKNFDSTIKYIQVTWGAATARQFIQKVDQTLRLLSKYPMLGSIEKGDIRGLQVTSQIRIIYRVSGKRILVLAFFDGRQHPSKKLS